ncbi:MAG TPA: DUF4197 family protein [Saprospiraceae bacterium]|nr:DUF4197 family protein [Saprospiraceae bacterium]
MKSSKYLLLFIIVSFVSCSTLMKSALKPSTLETITALREILNSSTFKALMQLKNLSGDDPMQTLPPEVNLVLNSLSSLGLSAEIAKSKEVIGKSAAIMLTESEGIMKDAISEVDFGDAVAVVTGGKDAATQVLKNNMKVVVKKRYSERLNLELNKSEVNKYWPLAAGTYNMFSKNKVDTALSDFMAERAVDAIFLAVGHEEQELRKDPASLGKAVVTKVFDYYMKRKS